MNGPVVPSGAVRRVAVAVMLASAFGVRLGVALGLAVAGASVVEAAGPKVVVLDPGHGGRVGGTHTPTGVAESAIVLGIARTARDLLEREGVKVVMTRDEDRDLALDDRVAIANGARAAVFVSVHSNYAPLPERCGTETYILAPSASDDASAELVHLENEGSGGAGRRDEDFGGGAGGIGGAGAGGAGGEGDGGAVDLILADLARMSAHKDSARLAREIQDNVGKVQGLSPSRGLRQAPFKVLRGAKMPAVLVEVGYLSHPAQGAMLATTAGQRMAGEALARGILRFLKVHAGGR